MLGQVVRELSVLKRRLHIVSSLLSCPNHLAREKNALAKIKMILPSALRETQGYGCVQTVQAGFFTTTIVEELFFFAELFEPTYDDKFREAGNGRLSQSLQSTKSSS